MIQFHKLLCKRNTDFKIYRFINEIMYLYLNYWNFINTYFIFLWSANVT